MQNVHFTPPKLAELFGVNVSTIKRWIDKGMLPAEVTNGGHRRVGREDLATFLGRYPKLRRNSYILNRLLRPLDGYDRIFRSYYSALRGTNPGVSERIIDQLYLRRTPLLDILESVISPTLVKIGSDWSRGRISVYDEHRMTFRIRLHLVRLQGLVPNPSPKRVALLACVPGEHHELSLQMLDLLLQSKSWTVHNLGINTPMEELERATRTLKPQLVCLTKVYPQPDSKEFLLAFAATCRRTGAKLAYGGSGWSAAVRDRQWLNHGVRFYPTLAAFESGIPDRTERRTVVGRR